MREYVNWLSKYLNINTNYDEIKSIVNKYIRKIIFDKKANKFLFEDPSFNNEWKKFSTSKSTDIDIYTPDELNTIINKIILNDLLYPNDITIKVISDIFNISILLIHRIPYGSSNQDVKRNEINDLVLSSTFIRATKNINDRPLFIFNKVEEKMKNIVYYPIVENNNDIDIKSLYMKFENIPENIKILIDLHLKK